MFEPLWDRFVIYVNAYYAVQEAYDSARRAWEQPAAGLKEFCRDANPFLWDAEGSAEEELYQSFCAAYSNRFGDKGCTASEGRSLARSWLAAQEGDLYGTALVASLDAVGDERAWEDACEPVERQLRARAVRLERTPQEMPELVEAPAPKTPTAADIEAVIALLSKGDERYAAELRARLAQDDDLL